jgi:S-adenosylmethionine:tRNA ribosyltransferase-isomerase
MMKLSDFSYSLPPELIAQFPCKKRDESRLLVLRRKTGRIEHLIFKDLPGLLGQDSMLVLNDTKVFKARIIGKRKGFAGKIEILVSHRLRDDIYNVLAKPSKKMLPGTEIVFDDERLKAKVLRKENGYTQMHFHINGCLHEILDEIGSVPLPPYIKRDAKEEDTPRYQTVYAENIGAIAAPTAGLHFTKALISRLQSNGMDIAYLTLHVGYGTFRPVKEEDITKHAMHEEYFEITDKTADFINNAKANNKKIVATGTTVCRALESAAYKQDTFYRVSNIKSSTSLFIYPGYNFKIVDMLLTNFHLPKTTLLMLVSAFAGRENIIKAYDEAIKYKYRFFSYGDAMLIL